MISERCKKFCKEDISLIENYDKAIADSTHLWDCHHRDEIKVLPSGMTVIRSRQELIENNRYYNCPANELIFLTHEEHTSLHKKGKTTWIKGRCHSKETIKKMSTSLTTSIFGKAFKEHYGIAHYDDCKLYMKEYMFYKRHGKFSWEVK